MIGRNDELALRIYVCWWVIHFKKDGLIENLNYK